MKKLLLSLMVLSLMILPLAACGGGTEEAAADDPLLGVYNSVQGEMMGITLSGEDVAGFVVELKSGNKAEVSADGATAKGTYTVDGDTLNISVEGEEMVGTIGEDTLTFDDMLGTGLKVTFAKEGSEAEASLSAGEAETAE